MTLKPQLPAPAVRRHGSELLAGGMTMQKDPWRRPRAEVGRVTSFLVLTKMWARCSDEPGSVCLLSTCPPALRDCTRKTSPQSALSYWIHYFARNYCSISLSGHEHLVVPCKGRIIIRLTRLIIGRCLYLTHLAVYYMQLSCICFVANRQFGG